MVGGKRLQSRKRQQPHTIYRIPTTAYLPRVDFHLRSVLVGKPATELLELVVAAEMYRQLAASPGVVSDFHLHSQCSAQLLLQDGNVFATGGV